MKKIRLPYLRQCKSDGTVFACTTAYDATTAHLINQTDIEVVLVGDSLGMIIHGDNDTIKVTVDDIAYHTKAVAKTLNRALLISDLPFMSYATESVALENVKTLMQAGAEMIKIEGGSEWTSIITKLSNLGIPICGHLGVQPQFLHKRGGFRNAVSGSELLNFLKKESLALIEAGIDCLLLECVPKDITKELTQSLDIPIIGIGSGVHCDGQILVFHDIIGASPKMPPFSKDFLSGNTKGIVGALSHFYSDVHSRTFPDN